MKLTIATLVILMASPAWAQDRPEPALEVFAGWAGFVDDRWVDHAALGGAGRVYLTPRLALGPEFTYMRGPGSHRDLLLTGNVTFDLVSFSAGQTRRVTPFVVAGAGMIQNRSRFMSGTFTSTEGAFTVGVGARVSLTDRIYVAIDTRVGWELHFRTAAALGIRLNR